MYDGPDRSAAAIATYRYLRLAIVAVVLSLVVSLLLERAHASCWQGSVSSYYYTPVHSVFIAALGVIGVALIAIRGYGLLEEVLLNQAGFLAPVVAFIPTGWSASNCPSNLTATSRQAVDQLLSGNRFFAKFSANNLLAFIIGGLSAVIITLVVAKVAGRTRRDAPLADLVVPAAGTAAVVVAGYIWHRLWPASFNTHAHSYSAVLMFALVAMVILSTALRDPSAGYRTIYFACAGTMAVGFIVALAVGLAMTWRHQVLVVEGIEVTAFVVFWFAQTIQLWDQGLPDLAPQRAAGSAESVP